jgi:hypothetical protein
LDILSELEREIKLNEYEYEYRALPGLLEARE